MGRDGLGGRVMGAVRLLVRSELRRRWRSLVVVALLVAFAGAVTLAAVAGARRTSTSFDRFQESVRSHDVLVFAEDIDRADVEQLRALPGRRRGRVPPPAGDGPTRRRLPRGRRAARRLAVPRRRPAAHRRRAGRRGREVPEEVVVPEPLARQTHLKVGDALPVQGYSPEQLAAISRDTTQRAPEARRARRCSCGWSGISRLPIDLSLQGRAGGVLILQRSFVEKYGAGIGNFSGETGGVLFVRLTDGGAGVDRFLGQLRRRARPAELRRRPRGAEHRGHPGLDRHPRRRHPRVRRDRGRRGPHRARAHHQPPGRAARGRPGRGARPRACRGGGARLAIAGPLLVAVGGRGRSSPCSARGSRRR